MQATADGITRIDEYGPATPSTMFAIASMTKAITTVAAMQLVERGVLDLDAPAGDYLSDLRDLPVLCGFDGAPRFTATRYQVTLRQLLTHTAGFAYVWNHPLALLAGAGGEPYLVHVPGERWHYGVNIDWVGRVIEAVTGGDLEQYFQERILRPLGMFDTTFRLTSDQQARLTPTWQKHADGSLQPSGLPVPPPCNGGGGLYSTAADYIRFLQAILRSGTTEEGVRLLSPASLSAMTANQTGALDVGRIVTTMPERSADVDFFPGESCGFGLGLLIHPNEPEGTFSWGGIRNTFFSIDPARGTAGVLMMQFLPFCDDAAMAMQRHFFK